jgi:hypothetical protein
MPKTPIPPKLDDTASRPCPESGDRASWSDDQKRREYYYDDAHGYEVYEPEKDDEPDEENPRP